MHVVIVESPAKSKTINKYLGSDYKVLASFGHIRDLPSKNGSVRPDEDFAMDYEISPDSYKHVKTIVDAVKKADSIYLATDPDREGEAISWHILEALKAQNALGKNTQVYRIAFNEITRRAVQYAIEHPRDIDMDLVNAQQARRALDYLVGFTLSPVLWRKVPGSRSAGRVQSVALRLICEREDEIERFITREYWDIKAAMANPAGDAFSARLTYVDGKKLEQFDLPDEKTTTAIVQALKGKQYRVVDVEKKQTQRKPQPPFTTSSLQQEAARKLGFGAKRTMMIAQKLYEGIDIGGETVGLITYMRTDGVTVSQEAISATRSLIAKNYGDQYVPKQQRMYTAKAKNAQEAHEAIRPTDVTCTPEKMFAFLDKDFLQLYELIWKRMVASQMENAVLDQVGVNITTTDNYAVFRATGSTIRFDGFYKLYIEGKDDVADDDEGGLLPPLTEGDSVVTKAIEPNQHFTQPPPRYSEASLVKKLEELGIGRPSTYASIISVLQDRNYVKFDKKRFIPEERGRIVTAFLVSFFRKYVQYDFTANLEDQLDHISAGDINWKAVLRDFWKDFIVNIEDVKQRDIGDILEALETLLERHLFKPDEKGNIHRECPDCKNGTLHLKLGKFGAFIGCSNYPECKHTNQIGDSAEESAGSGAEPRIVGADPTTGLDILVKKGPYGWYLQLGEDPKGKEKPKRTAIPKNHDPATIDLQTSVGLLALPRDVGLHPETGKMIKANIGRFGPYLQHDGKFTSLKQDDPISIGINRAVTVIAEAPKKKGADPLRIVGKHPEDDSDIGIYEGRYGPYVKHGKINATLPKGETPESITLETALALLAGKSKGKTTKKASAKKSAAKKETTKKTADKKTTSKKKTSPKKKEEE